VGDGTLAPTRFARYMRPIRHEVERRLEVGQTRGVPKTAGMCREILRLRQALWTFVRHPEVEPTHNAAERDPSRYTLAQRQLWDPERGRVPRWGSHDDGGGDPQATAQACPRLSDDRV
jgi:hypothetical protein